MTTIMYVSAILAVVIILTIIGVLSRYRRCKPNQVLVVYGKTGGEKKSAKLYHGGAAFVLPIIQSYDILSMEPMQIDCRLTGALSSQNIRVDVPTTITVAISTNPEIMQNAAERLLGMDTESTENLITDIVYGQMRLIIAEMTIEKLNSDRDEFLDKARKNIDNELNKLGLYLLNINISDIRDEAGYIMNLGKEAESKALNEAQANIEEQEKLGAIKIAVQQKEKETVVAETKKEKEVALALTDKEKQIGVAQADRDRAAVIAKTLADKESAIARSKAELEVNKAEAERMEEVGKNKAEADKEAAIAIQDSEAQIKKAEAEKNASIGYNNAQKEVAVSVSELQIIKAQSEKKAGEEKVKSEAAVKTAKELADKEVEEAKAKKVQAALKAEKIVPAETQKEEAILQADAEAEKIKRRAAAEAAANLAKAEAEAKAIKMKLEAEAEGKKKSLMAEADGFKAMVEAAESNPQIAIQYKMVNQWKEIAGEQVKAFEHINLGNITVFDGGQNSTGNFLNNVVKTVAPALGVIDQLPIADTLKKLKGDDKK